MNNFNVSKSWTNVIDKIKKKPKDFRNGYAFRSAVSDSPTTNPKVTGKDDVNRDLGQTKDKNSKPNDCESGDDKRDPESSTCMIAVLVTCILCLPLGFICVVVGLATPYWYETGNGHMGLFQMCYTTETSSCSSADTFITEVSPNSSKKWTAVVALSIVGLGLYVVDMGMFCCYMALRRRTMSRIVVGFISSTLLLITAAAITSAVILAAALQSDTKDLTNIAWSFYLIAVAAGFAVLCFCLNMIHVFMMVVD